MDFVSNDGGRIAAGFKGSTGDCVTRSIAIITDKPYREVYDALFDLGQKTPRNGVKRKVYQSYLAGLGFKWVPTMKIGQGCKVHLVDGELPDGRLIVRLSKHLTAVIDGVIHDTHDPQREVHTVYGDGRPPTISRRCVYGYFIQE